MSAFAAVQPRMDLGAAIQRSRDTGVLAQLIALDPNASAWQTRITVAAYRRGIEDGISGAALANPYRERTSNFAKGANNPFAAFHDGWVDGMRIRGLLKDPNGNQDGVFPQMRQSEFRALQRLSNEEAIR